MNRVKNIVIFAVVSHISLICSMQNALETEREFIRRTHILPACKQYGNNPLFGLFIEPSQPIVDAHYFVWSPCCKYRAVLRPAIDNKRSQLVVVTPEGYVRARQFLDTNKIIALALSSNPDVFASIYQRNNDPRYPSDITEVVRIQRVDTKRTIKEIVLPKTFETACAANTNSVIAFNKEGSKIIVWGINAMQRGSYKGSAYGTPAHDYSIFDTQEAPTP